MMRSRRDWLFSYQTFRRLHGLSQLLCIEFWTSLVSCAVSLLAWPYHLLAVIMLIAATVLQCHCLCCINAVYIKDSIKMAEFMWFFCATWLGHQLLDKIIWHLLCAVVIMSAGIILMSPFSASHLIYYHLTMGMADRCCR